MLNVFYGCFKNRFIRQIQAGKTAMFELSNRSNIFLCFLLSIAISNVQAQENNAASKLAVLSFDSDATEESETIDIEAMRNITEKAFSETTDFYIIPYQDADKILKQAGVNNKELYKDNNTAKAKNIDIDFIITAEVDCLKNAYMLKLYFYNVKQGIFITSDNTKIKKKSGRDLKNGVYKLVKSLTSTDDFVKIYAEITHDPPLYAIGDPGPAGGIVFFIKSASSDGWRYLEAAPADIKGTLPWGFYSEGAWIPPASGTTAAIGDGGRNTRILSGGLILNTQLTAADACAFLNYNGYSDWFLPSKDELNLLYHNLAKKGLGNFNGISYWSSSQSSSATAWFQRFEDGKQYYNGRKTELLFVRAIRAF